MRVYRGSGRLKHAVVVSVLALAGVTMPLPHDSAEAAKGMGPQRSIKCPARAVKLTPRSPIQKAINRRPAGTVFCLRAGTYRRKSPITPKTGNRFIGQYGAILDGSGWKTTDPWQGIFRAHNQNIDDVVIRNLVIRRSPQRGIHAFYNHSDGWVIENNDIRGNRMGISHGNSFRIRNNIIRRNWQYGIGSYRSKGSVIERNRLRYNARRSKEFPGNAGTSKWFLVTDTIVRDNVVSDNHWHGIWFDTGHERILIEKNVLLRNRGNAIFHEHGGATVIRNNQVRGSLKGIYIADSHDTDVYGNRLANNEHAISLFRDGNRNGSDLFKNIIRANTVRVPSTPLQPGHPPRGAVMWCSNLSTAECTRYSTNRSNSFAANVYLVPKVSDRYWFWSMRLMDWGEWQGSGQDGAGSVQKLPN